MKTLRWMPLAALTLILTSCMPGMMGRGGGGRELKVEPVELNAQTPSLNIDPSKKLWLKVAVVVPDPMAYTIIYDLPSFYNRDLTAEYRKNGFQLERELSKVCSETFSQAFNQVVVVREMPQAGQYDAIVELKIGKISAIGRMVNRFLGKLACDVTTEWTMSVLDDQNREVLNKKGLSPARSFQWGATTAHKDFNREMGPVMSGTLTDLAKEWGAILHSSEVLVAQAAKRNNQSQ